MRASSPDVGNGDGEWRDPAEPATHVRFLGIQCPSFGDRSMDMSTINWLAVGAASLVGFVVGPLWYGPLFGKAWMASVGIRMEDARKANMGRIYTICLLLQALMAFCLAMFLNAPEIGLPEGATYGFLTGAGWIAPALVINALFEQKSGRYMAINGGYWIVVFTLMGVILGGWR
jgi:hypothetical protein